MIFLLDTHTLIWYLEGDKRLSQTAKDLIDNVAKNVFVSHVSFIEIAIKKKLSKLPSGLRLNEYLERAKESDIAILPITESHILDYESIPLLPNHKDPFDRLLLATALSEGLVIVTIDEKFDCYKDLISTIW
jgi:PIN domain nuclease of toxin-antitoxin system